MNYAIEQLIERLESRPHSPGVTNPYRLPHRSDNLRHYLKLTIQRPGRRILVVAEALGYRGGLLTGIPLSSERLLTEPQHPFLRSLSKQVTVSGNTSEATASLVWDYLSRRRTLPLFWNAFPFHPHLPGQPDTNRAPNASELAEGRQYLELVHNLYSPGEIAGLGRKGTRAAELCFPNCRRLSIRHPSYGGKEDFRRGMDKLLG